MATPTGAPRISLARLLDLLGTATVDCLAAPAGLEVGVTTPRVYDPAEPSSIGPGDVVLAVNVDPASPDAAVAVTEAARLGAAAVAVKGDRDQITTSVGALATARGVALLHVAGTASWDQLHALIRNAANTAGAPVDTDENVPLGDLFALANTLAAAIGAAVTIEDSDTTLVAYSNLDHPIDEARRDTILGRRTPGRWAAVLEEEGVPRQLLTSPGTAVHVHDPNEQARDRLVISVRAGTEIVGTIWVVEGDKPLDARAGELLEQTAPLAALHLLRHRAADDLHRSERARLLQALLDSEQPARDIGESLGIDPTSPCVVVNFHLSGSDDVDLAVRRQRALDLIVLSCDALHRRVVCTGIGQSVYALFPSTADDSDTRLQSFVTDLAARASEALAGRVVAGIGSLAPRLTAAAASRLDADRTVRVLSRDATRQTARIDEVRTASMMLELGDLLADHPELRLPAVDALATYDAEHSRAYVETLRALARVSWDTTAAARDLNLHPNSLRYRLRRLEELTGLVLDDPAHRLLISLQFLAGDV